MIDFFRWKMEPILPRNTMMKLGWEWVKSTSLKSYSRSHGYWRNSSPNSQNRNPLSTPSPWNFAPRTWLQKSPTSPKKSPTFQSQICPSTSKFAHHFAKVVRYFLIHGRFKTSICLLHVGRSGLQRLKKGNLYETVGETAYTTPRLLHGIFTYIHRYVSI